MGKGGFFGKGGTHKYCNKLGVPPEKIDAIRKALEYFAFDTIKFDKNFDVVSTMDVDEQDGNFDIDLSQDENDASLWELNGETKRLLGVVATGEDNSGGFKFDEEGGPS